MIGTGACQLIITFRFVGSFLLSQPTSALKPFSSTVFSAPPSEVKTYRAFSFSSVTNCSSRGGVMTGATLAASRVAEGVVSVVAAGSSFVTEETVFVGTGIGGKSLLVIGNQAARNSSEMTMIKMDFRSIRRN